MTMKQGRFRKYLTDRNISLIIRWWAAGAVYFFIGWGTTLGNQQSIIDFVVLLGLVMGVFNILILNPGLQLMFNLSPKRPKQENTGWQRTSDYLLELIKNILIMLIISLLYLLINKAAISLFGLPPTAVPIPGEPILFGVFYVVVFVLWDVFFNKLKGVIGNYQSRGNLK